MASRFMKIKRVIIPFMPLVVMTSQLAGCATMTSDEMLKSMNESPDVSIEYAIPDPDKQSLDASGVINMGDQQIVSDSDIDRDIGLIENQDSQEKAELSGDELIRYFQLAYDSCESFESTSQEERINFELDILASFCDTDGEKLPADYADQYKAWRPVDQQAPEVTLTFTDCNETVYATGTVNLRSGPSTNDEKVGALNKNQSVTRIGIGTGDYANWSKVRLSDGSEVYVASKYLTTTKPVSQSSSKPSGGGTSSTVGSQQPADSSQGSNHAHSAEDDDPILSQLLGGNSEAWDPFEGLTPEEKEAAIKANQEATQKVVDGITGSFG